MGCNSITQYNILFSYLMTSFGKSKMDTNHNREKNSPIGTQIHITTKLENGGKNENCDDLTIF